MNELTTTKLVITFGIFIISFLSAAAPLTLVSRRTNVGDSDHHHNYFFSVGNMFASGVLLAAGFVHQLPDAMTALDDVNVIAADFPWATFLTGLIFCFFVMIEECIHTSSSTTHWNNHNIPCDDQQQQQQEEVVADHNACEKLVVVVEDQKTDHKSITTHAEDDTHNNSTFIYSDHSVDKHKAEQATLKQNIDTAFTIMEQKITHTNRNSERTKLLLPKHTKVDYNNDNKEYKVVESIYDPTCRMSELLFQRSAISITSVCDEQQQKSLKRVLSVHNDLKKSSSSLARRSQDTTLFELILPTNNDCDDENLVVHSSHTEKHRSTQQEDARHGHGHVVVGGSFTSSIILLLALSIHSLFEGLGLGISATTTELTSITAAIVAHKAFAGYALGSAMVSSGTLTNTQMLVLCAVFSSCGSVGVGMGMILQDAVDPENSVPIGIIQAMVAGTFLYVAIVEIAMKELSMMTTNTTTQQHSTKNTTSTTGLWEVHSKLVALLVGYVLMSVLAIWV